MEENQHKPSSTSRPSSKRIRAKEYQLYLEREILPRVRTVPGLRRGNG